MPISFCLMHISYGVGLTRRMQYPRVTTRVIMHIISYPNSHANGYINAYTTNLVVGYTSSLVIISHWSSCHTSSQTSFYLGNYLSWYINSYINIQIATNEADMLAVFGIFIWSATWIVDWVLIWTNRGAVARTMIQVNNTSLFKANDRGMWFLTLLQVNMKNRNWQIIKSQMDPHGEECHFFFLCRLCQHLLRWLASLGFCRRVRRSTPCMRDSFLFFLFFKSCG